MYLKVNDIWPFVMKYCVIPFIGGRFFIYAGLEGNAAASGAG
jgi:hypothetical protein